MVKKLLYLFSVLCILAITVMITLNGLDVVEYRFNVIASYISRVLIGVLVIVFAMAVVNVRRNKDEIVEDYSKVKPKVPDSAKLYPAKSNAVNNTSAFKPAGTFASERIHAEVPKESSKHSQQVRTPQNVPRQSVRSSYEQPAAAAPQHRPATIPQRPAAPIQPTNTTTTAPSPHRPAPRSMDINVKRKRPRKIQL